MKLSALAEGHSSAVDDEGDPSVIRTSRQRSAVVLDPQRRRVAPGEDVCTGTVRAFGYGSIP